MRVDRIDIIYICTRRWWFPENNLCKSRVAFSMCFQLNYLLEFLSNMQTYTRVLNAHAAVLVVIQCTFDVNFSFSRQEKLQ